AVAISSCDCGMAFDLSPGLESVVAGLPGWPLPVATRAPGVPAPHDPEPEEGDPAPLVPPSGDTWGPAQRRLGADEVALQWSAWRSQVTDDAPAGAGAAVPSETSSGAGAAVPSGTPSRAGTAVPSGTPSGSGAAVPSGALVPAEAAAPSSVSVATPRAQAEATPRPTTWFDRPSSRKAAPPAEAAASTPAAPSRDGVSSPDEAAAASVADPYAGVRRALDELRGYLVEPPPVGRVRSSDSGTDGGVRTLRADGPGWSLVARPDDMAFVLLDELPNEVLPVARGPRLPALLEGLDAMAVRPA
ncbi:hypothetical protein, partial [Streptomyces sp. NPDC056480]|uniref:hypothetical protein n=1 Tax=Streptomyces sp. NPDC056480 TaxID=3345833 RepID=UPI003677015F